MVLAAISVARNQGLEIERIENVLSRPRRGHVGMKNRTVVSAQTKVILYFTGLK